MDGKKPPARDCLGSSVLATCLGKGLLGRAELGLHWAACLDVHVEAGVSRVGCRVNHVGKEGALIPLPPLGEGATCAYLAQVYFCGFRQHRAGTTVIPWQVCSLRLCVLKTVTSKA